MRSSVCSFFRSVVIAGGLTVILASCQTTSSGNASDGGPLTNPGFTALPSSPSLRHGDESDRHRLALFVSPACVDCRNLFTEAVERLAANDATLANSMVTINMIPRQSRDVPLILGFMCVRDEYRPDAILDYYGTLNRRHRSIRSWSELVAMHRNVLRSHGVSDEMRERCENSQEARALVATVYGLADSYRTKDRVPVIVHDDAYIDTIELDEALEIIASKEPKA